MIFEKKYIEYAKIYFNSNSFFMDYKVFGCKTNKYFAEKWLAHSYLNGKKGYFIASCVVTDKAKNKWLKYALKIIPTLGKNEHLYLSGCGNIRNGVVDPKFYQIYSELEKYQEKIKILPEDPSDFVMTKEERIKQMKTKVRSLKKLNVKSLFTRKYMVIQTGCDNFCTFCLTVQARGRHRWRPADEIIEEINEFVTSGGKEVVFTGINLGAWGAKSSNDFTDSRIVELIEAVLEKTTLERLRISSLGVEFLDDRLIALFGEDRINPYPHLSIQSASSSVLEAMNRHYDGEKVREVLQKLRHLKRHDGAILNIGADIIVGFPGESDEDYQESLQLVKDFQISSLHAFPFSPHIDHYSVPAGKFANQVPNHLSQRRVKEIIAAGEQAKQALFEQSTGKKLTVLVEKARKDKFSGWTQNYIAANEKNFLPDAGQEIKKGKCIHGILI
ncbi:hypothetical protein CSB09_01215 [Candidatus Gracilibacteria bacterium]|nr:MAG: hypothetical protein CSB09_01215 [Candidatus Gracilibacteria bacterium]